MIKQSNIKSLLVVGTLFCFCFNLSSQQPQTTTQTLSYQVIEDSLFISKQGAPFKSLPFQPKKELTPENYLEDRVFGLAECVVVLRNVLVKGAFCHFPEIDEVEIINSEGRHVSIGKDIPAKFSSGITLLQAFNGNRYDHPFENLGLISNTAEGQLYGFLMINHQGDIFDFPLEKYLLSDFNIHFEKERFVLSLIDGRNAQKRYELIIYACGAYEYWE